MNERTYAPIKDDDETLSLIHYGSDQESIDQNADLELGADAPLRIDTTTGPANNAIACPQSSGTSSKDVVSWKDLPKKDQLLVITLARLSEPLVQTSLQRRGLFNRTFAQRFAGIHVLQLQWFDPSLPDSVISSQAGVLHASFTAAQFFTAMIWGRVADSKRAGRKTVILIGLFGTLISCVGFGFSTSFYQALCFRLLGGATNGNVGVMRTMISETVREKKYQSRAFIILPMTFNIGVIVGPILGGILSDPAGSYPDTFGNVDFFRKFPYATPNIVSAIFLLISMVMCWLMLEETHDGLRDKGDFGIALGRKIRTLFRGKQPSIEYKPLHSRDTSISTVSTDMEMSPVSPRVSSIEVSRLRPKATTTKGRRYTARLPFRRILTPNVAFTLLAHFFLAFHVGTFNSLWFVFLSTPVYNPAKPEAPGFTPRLPFRFTGGLGLPPRSVGMAMALLGCIGITMQLWLYPRMSARLGTVRSWRICLALFPIAYTLLPFLSVVPSTTPPPSQKTGPAIWAAIGGVLFVQVTGRTFALPAQTILVNNCTPHPSVLGTVHGLGQSVSSFARTVGPVLGGWLYGLGLSHGLVGGVFWGIAGMAVCGLVASFWVREGSGHEIWLEGDEEDGD